jgi:hypothetical protein
MALGVPLALLGQCAPDGCTPASSAPVTSSVTRVVDGDTLEVLVGGGRHVVRVIGIDAPESGRCGAREAEDALRALVGGRTVALVPGARDDTDRYGRLLRYVDVGAIDAGRSLIADGLAVARYDSRDGYGRHAREADYVALDAATVAVGCPALAPQPVATSRYYANCAAVRAAGAAPLHRGQPGYEAPRLDRDGDGVACE